ncbi:MAG TPA: hypothetical protein VFI17_13460 [Solirubrobacterales bacterium]|nr:hypothetical protein [Solirubrobacterales bacterium]
MLAYLFWHRPRPNAEAAEYEEAQRRFHQRLELESACFRLDRLPFDDGPGYEDWYLVEDWQGLGKLNEAAVDAHRKGDHDRAAAMAGAGWGGIYAHVSGEVEIPARARWLRKPRGQSLATLLAEIPAETPVWQRQMVLGPAPELCVSSREGEQPEGRRERL